MKWTYLLLASVVFLAANCNREAAEEISLAETEPTPTDTVLLVNHDTVSMYPYDRNDIPPPPPDWNEDVDTSSFNDCQKRVWRYIKQFYPVGEPNELGVEIYTMQEEGGRWQERDLFHRDFLFFFEDTLTQQLLWSNGSPCHHQLDTTFFLEHIGTPTLRGAVANSSFYNGEPIVKYLYQFKCRDRSGPCPSIFDTPPYNVHNVFHYEYCAMLRLTFLQKNGGLASSMYGQGY